MKKSIYSAKYRKFLDCLVKARRKAGLTQTDVAKAVGKSQSFVSKYENGERRLDLIEFLEISELLNVKPMTVITEIQRVSGNS